RTTLGRARITLHKILRSFVELPSISCGVIPLTSPLPGKCGLLHGANHSSSSSLLICDSPAQGEREQEGGAAGRSLPLEGEGQDGASNPIAALGRTTNRRPRLLCEATLCSASPRGSVEQPDAGELGTEGGGGGEVDAVEAERGGAG